MKPREHVRTGQVPFPFHGKRLDEVIDMSKPIVQLAKAIDWKRVLRDCSEFYTKGRGHPPLNIQKMVAFQIYKYMNDLSDEKACEEYEHNFYLQYFCGEEYIQKDITFHRTSVTRFRQRVWSKSDLLVKESIEVAKRLKFIKDSDLRHISTDTTAAENNIKYPTDGELNYKILQELVALAREGGVPLKRTYRRLAKRAYTLQRRFWHKKSKSKKIEVKEENKAKALEQLDVLKGYLKNIIGEIEGIVERDAELLPLFEGKLSLAERIRTQKHGDGQPYIYSTHMPYTLCIIKGKLHKKYEFGLVAAIATTLKPAKCGHLILGIMVFESRPYDGHTLDVFLPHVEKMTGVPISDVVGDAAYRKNNADPRYNVFAAKDKKHPCTKKQLFQRSSIEAVISHAKNHYRMRVNYLWHMHGAVANVNLAAAGLNFRRIYKMLC